MRGGGGGSTPGQATKIPHASWPKKQNMKQKQYSSKFKKDLKNRSTSKNLKKNSNINFYFFFKENAEDNANRDSYKS